jgi:threo-3-hydroxy-L-aspartate ammonia-lyase
VSATAPGTDLPVTIADVHRAAERLRGRAHRTPILHARQLDRRVGAKLSLKAEHLQRVGAFKFRGAYNAIAELDEQSRQHGVVAFSSGNHAQAIACAAELLGVPATIVMPTDAPQVKLDATRGYGAEIVTYDRYREDRRELGERIARERGATVIPPYDHPAVIAGQGTVALELLEDVDDLDLLVVPIGGGGLLSGCAVAAKAVRHDLRIVGVEPAQRYAARTALERGEVVEVAVPRTVLDGQQTPEIGARPLQILRALVDEIVGIDDDAVLATVRTLAIRMKQVVEPSGASALAAVLSGAVRVDGGRVGVVISGGNIAPSALAAVLDHDGALLW